MNIFCCPAGVVEQPNPNGRWVYFRGAINIPVLVTKHTYVRLGRIGDDGNYAGPVGTWGFGNFIFACPGGDTMGSITYDWRTLPSPKYEPSSLFEFWNDDVYPKLWYFTLDLHTKGYTTMAGIVHDLWMFGDGIRPVQPFILPRGIAQMQIGALPR